MLFSYGVVPSMPISLTTSRVSGETTLYYIPPRPREALSKVAVVYYTVVLKETEPYKSLLITDMKSVSRVKE